MECFHCIMSKRRQDWKPYKRWEEYMAPRVYPSGNINPTALTFNNYVEYLEARGLSMDKTSSLNGNWTFFGSQNYVEGTSGYNGGVGRINVIAFDPNNSNVLYAGSPTGGLWKSTTNGNSWSSLTDGVACWGVSGIAVDPNNSNIIYILTGDGDAAQTYSVGVMKSTNGGVTWNNTGLTWNTTNYVRGYKLAMDPNNSSILYAVTNQGLYKTTNAGSSWTNVKTGNYRDMEIKPNNSNYLYLAGTNAIHRSTNAGSTWSQIQTFSSSRIALAVTPANGNYVYALAGSGSGFLGLYRSTNSGASFTQMSSSPNILGYNLGGGGGNQVWYDLALAASPSNANEIHTGGINTWKSTNGGSSWIQTSYWYKTGNSTGYTHADIHELVFNGSTIYCGSDGGVFRSTNAANDWIDVSNGLAISQFYRIGGTPQNVNLYIGGTQDCGTNIIEGPVIPDLTQEHVLGADGMEAAIDYTNANIMYCCIQGGGLRRSTNGGNNWSGIQPSNLGGGAWVTPFVLHPTNPNLLLAGYTDVGVRNNSTGTWTDLSNGAIGGGACNMVTYAPSNANYIYAAKSSSVWRSSNGGSTWTNITSGLPGGTYTYVTVASNDPQRVYVTRSGYTANSKVFMSTNAGSSWTNISGSALPNIPANCVVYETGSDNGVYVGMDCGVYYKDDNLSDWVDFSDGLPNIIVKELEINYTNNQLRAATFGRSIWESDLYGTDCPVDLVLSGSISGTQTIEASNTITSTQTLTTTANITYSAGTAITLNGSFNVPLGAVFSAVMNGCSTPKRHEIVEGNYEWVDLSQEEDPMGIGSMDGFAVGSFPNPFEAMTRITFKLPVASRVNVEVYDETLRRVKVLYQGVELAEGVHHVDLDASGLSGGLFFVKFSTQDYQSVHKIIRMK